MTKEHRIEFTVPGSFAPVPTRCERSRSRSLYKLLGDNNILDNSYQQEYGTLLKGYSRTMATNRSMLAALERMVELIDELNAWKPVLKSHIARQKQIRTQQGKDSTVATDFYQYNEKIKSVRRTKG